MSLHGKAPLFAIALCLSLTFASACADENEPGGNPNPLPTTCTIAEQGNSRCNGLDVQACNGTVWGTATTCTDQRCVTTSSTTAECQDEISNTCTVEQNGDQRCNGLDIEDCNGTSWATSDTCTGNEVCILTGTTAECVDGSGADATAFNGLWLYQSMTFGTTTYTRGDTNDGIIGDIEFASTSTSTGAISYRLAMTEDEFLTDAPLWGNQNVTLEGNNWVIMEDSDIMVFGAALVGNTLTLTFDANDSRNTSTQVPTVIVFTRRATPWGTETVGEWSVTSMNVPAITIPVFEAIPMNTCIPYRGIVGKLFVDIFMSSRHVMERTQTGDLYSAYPCTAGNLVTTGQIIDTGVGLVEEEDNIIRYWEWRTAYDLDGSLLGVSTYTMVFDVIKETGANFDMSFTRTACIASDSYTDGEGTFHDDCDYYPTIIKMVAAE